MSVFLNSSRHACAADGCHDLLRVKIAVFLLFVLTSIDRFTDTVVFLFAPSTFVRSLFSIDYSVFSPCLLLPTQNSPLTLSHFYSYAYS